MTNLEDLNRVLQDATDTLRRSNEQADRAEYLRWRGAVKTAINRWGPANALGVIPDTLRDCVEPHELDYSNQDRDYVMAAEVMEAALLGVDLPYSEGSTRAKRQEKLGVAIEAMKAVLP